MLKRLFNVTRNFNRKINSSAIFYSDAEVNKSSKKHIEEDKARLQWRNPIDERSGEWYSKFKLFAPEEDTNSKVLTFMQQPINLSPSAIKTWYISRAIKLEKHMQQFIPERHAILGNDLAAAHFIVHRGGSIRFLGSKQWIKKDENDDYDLPKVFDETKLVEAIKCDNMTLYYEGLANIRRLKHLKFLSFHNVETFDDWHLDRVSGSEFINLEVLDLSGTKVTFRGLNALYRIDTLKLLILDNYEESIEMKLMCGELEDLFPNLKIRFGDEIH